ncbi:hypothetical protein [Sutcliffiella deserti]|uniref:hypothetical protein n=1 Tax=Sutcliffiella deserti TaxID=2875501 RepID=UPI001CBF7B92|nr:hypothetical protein [Sutcliffiella deserti]
MKKLILVLLTIVILNACSQESQENKRPPELKVSSNNDEVTAVIGAYDWTYESFNGNSTTESVDSDIPPRIVVNQTKHLNTTLGSKVNLDFTKAPKEIKVSIWNTNEKEREVDVVGSSFNTDEKGYIIYEIHATWDQGSVSYAVNLHVE